MPLRELEKHPRTARTGRSYSAVVPLVTGRAAAHAGVDAASLLPGATDPPGARLGPAARPAPAPAVSQGTRREWLPCPGSNRHWSRSRTPSRAATMRVGHWLTVPEWSG